ncbi:MAG: nickel-dependent hydrogenase large subunit [Xanthomonadales bacterium]|nr:nickel-dependent hydrogenase large subunit [Xanthomonadales bacterium]
MSAAGCLDITITRGAGAGNRVDLSSTRPVHACRVFKEQPFQQALALMPRLFAVCATAQEVAGWRAVEQARGTDPEPAVEAGREFLVQLETAREHLWRVVVDWPEFLGEPARPEYARRVHALMGPAKQTLNEGGWGRSGQPDRVIDELCEMLDELVFRRHPGAWSGLDDLERLQRWWQQTPTVAARLLRSVSENGWERAGAAETCFLPDLDWRDLNQKLRSERGDRFVEQPRWQQGACETTPLARQRHTPLMQSLLAEYGAGLLTRLAAQLQELARTPEVLRALVGGFAAEADWPGGIRSSCGDGCGISQVEAARGRLIHRVELDGEKVRRYQIVAPTEWNFHPDGVVSGALRTLAGETDDDVRQQADLLVTAIDPCVDYRLEVH